MITLKNNFISLSELSNRKWIINSENETLKKLNITEGLDFALNHYIFSKKNELKLVKDLEEFNKLQKAFKELNGKTFSVLREKLTDGNVSFCSNQFDRRCYVAIRATNSSKAYINIELIDGEFQITERGNSEGKLLPIVCDFFNIK